MKYVVLLAGDGAVTPWDEMSADERQACMDRFGAFDHACQARDGVEILAGEALGDGTVATTMRTDAAGQVTLTDGPFAEAAEQIGGFYLLEVPDLEVLVELCRQLPPYDMDLRPVLDVE